MFFLNPRKTTRSGLVNSFAFKVEKNEAVDFTEVLLAIDETRTTLLLIKNEAEREKYEVDERNFSFYRIKLDVLMSLDTGWTKDEILEYIS